MKYLLLFLLILTLTSFYIVWTASQYKHEIKAAKPMGPERDCNEFKGKPKEYAACFGYE